MQELIRSILEEQVETISNIYSTDEIVNNVFEYKGFYLTPLLLSVKIENYEICKLLIDKGANVSTADKIVCIDDLRYVDDGVYPVHHACRQGNLKIAELLIERGANPNQETSLGMTPFLYAVQTNNLDLIKYLTPLTNNINKTMSQNYNAINLAISGFVKYEIVEYLVSLRIDVNNDGAGHWTPLLSCVAKERYDVAKLLIDNGANVKSKTEAGWDIFYLAKNKEKLYEILQ
jgi:ankyrin repeat protein